MMDLENHTKIQGHDMNGLYDLINSGYTNNFNQQLNSQVTKALKPVGPYSSNVNAITPTVLNTNSSGLGLWDSLSNPGLWQGMGSFMGGLGSLGNMGLGFKSLGLLEDQLAMQQDAWSEQKAELDRLRQTRDKLNTSYMA